MRVYKIVINWTVQDNICCHRCSCSLFLQMVMNGSGVWFTLYLILEVVPYRAHVAYVLLILFEGFMEKASIF
jgi:hypothetical protein